MKDVYEYEERAFFSEKDLGRIQHTLEDLAISCKRDNKISYFFVLPEVNVSIATSATKTVVKYKGGQLGRGNGFKEHEFTILPHALPEALALFSALLHIKPQISEQFRLNYDLGDKVEIALKYTHMWGFHLELERVYQAPNEAERKRQERISRTKLAHVAEKLGVQLIDDAAMEQFKEQCSRNINRGTLDPKEFRLKYGHIFTD
jgi:adenylate cyclase class IV